MWIESNYFNCRLAGSSENVIQTIGCMTDGRFIQHIRDYRLLMHLERHLHPMSSLQVFLFRKDNTENSVAGFEPAIPLFKRSKNMKLGPCGNSNRR
jgi:hypothetical protein